MSFRFQFRRGTTAERNASNPILAAGEPAVVLDSGQPAELVLGDGVTAMADLRAAVWDDDARLAAAATATQPGDFGTAAAADVADLATSAQGAKADTAVQPAALPDPALSSALSPLAAALRSGADTSVLLIGDSTGNATDEWFYLFGQWLAAQFPEYTVEHRLWDDTNKKYARPTYIQTGPLGIQYAYLPGSLNDLSQTQPAALTNGDLDLRVKIAADDWTPAVTGQILSRFGSGGDRLFRFGLGSNGALSFDWTTDGSTIQTVAISTAVNTLTNGVAAWVRVTLDIDNGSGQHEIKFYTSANDGATWNQLGSTITRAGTTSIFTGGTGVWEIGGRGGSAELLAGKWYEVEVRNGIGDTFPLLLAPLSSAWYPIGATTPVTRGGSPLLTLLNGSIGGGSVASTFTPQIAGMAAPGRHSVALISGGHNDVKVGLPWRSDYSTLAAAISARTLCPVVAVSQNPKATPTELRNIDAHRQRFADIAAWSQYGPGRGYLNVYQAFMDDGRAMSLLVSGDGTHPTAAGAQLWADTLTDALEPLL